MSDEPEDQLHLTRCVDQPLVHPASHPAIGHNINGPCVVRVPDWVVAPLGRYYMYFAHHTGMFIRMAVADQITGPWQVLDATPLHLSDTGFTQRPVTHRMTASGEKVVEPAHIASPDVHVMQDERVFVMLFHGLHADGSQMTRIATSVDGLSFSVGGFDADLAPPYLRLCRIGARFVGIAWGGAFFTSESLFGPFRQDAPVFQRPNGPDLIPRHPTLVWRNGVLHCFYTLIGDRPERLWHFPAWPAEAPQNWRIGEPRVVMTPQLDWEGARLPKTTSKIGEANKLENALRDPFVFEDHLFYVAGGEQAIGLARIRWS